MRRLLTALVRSMEELVSFVLSLGDPPQVRKGVVGSIAIQMGRKMTLRAFAPERLQHKIVDQPEGSLARHLHRDASIVSAPKWPHRLPGSNTSYAAIIGNIVETFEAGNGFPYLHTVNYSGLRTERQEPDPQGDAPIQ